MKQYKKEKPNNNICEVKRCRNESTVIYSASKSGRVRLVCNKHWEMHCDKVINLKGKKTYKKKVIK